MARRAFLVSSLVLLVASLVLAQEGRSRSRRSAPNPTLNSGAYGGPAVTFRGTLKQVTNKEIVMQSDEDQTIVLRRTHKTKFFKAGKEIKPSLIAQGAPLAVDVTDDPEMKPVALNVFVDPPKPKNAEPPDTPK
ncbi:MAG TPA: hypothetical protein VFA33_14180 [Bryobacteraceae bacterium]|nr:hypothetical protein [Bryobacteraceae bacterium]